MLYRVAGGEAKHGVHVGGPRMVRVSDVACNSQPYCREHLQQQETNFGSRWGQQGVPGGWCCNDGEVGLSG